MIRFPHPLSLLVGCILLAAAMSYVLPPGRFERRDDPVTGRRVVVAGTYHVVPASRVDLLQALVAVPNMQEEIIALVPALLVGLRRSFARKGALTKTSRTWDDDCASVV